MAEPKYEVVPIGRLRANPFNPRRTFDASDRDEDQLKIADMALSIKKDGIMQPLVVRRKGNVYEVLAGERRHRAAQIAGLKKVPTVVRDVDDIGARRYAVVENVHRLNLTAEEKVEAFGKLRDADPRYLHGKVGAGKSNDAGIRLMAHELGVPEPSLRRFIEAYDSELVDKMRQSKHFTPGVVADIERVRKTSPKAAKVLTKAVESGGLKARRLTETVSLIRRAPKEKAEAVAETIAKAAESRAEADRAHETFIAGELEEAKEFVESGKVRKQLSWELRGDQARLRKAITLAEMARNLDETYLETFYDPKARAQAVDALFEAAQALLTTTRAGRNPANIKRWAEDHDQRKALASGTGGSA